MLNPFYALLFDGCAVVACAVIVSLVVVGAICAFLAVFGRQCYRVWSSWRRTQRGDRKFWSLASKSSSTGPSSLFATTQAWNRLIRAARPLGTRCRGSYSDHRGYSERHGHLKFDRNSSATSRRNEVAMTSEAASKRHCKRFMCPSSPWQF